MSTIRESFEIVIPFSASHEQRQAAREDAMKVRFEVVALRAQKKWTDERGKRHQATEKFWQTISPFNKNVDGSIKTREQILEELKIERDRWLARAAI